MSQIGILKELKKTYSNSELLKEDTINDICFQLHRDGKINWPLYVSQPMTMPELEDLLSYNTNKDIKGDEGDEDSFKSFELDDQQQIVKSLLDGWCGYEKQKMKKVRNLVESLEKRHNLQTPINWIKTISLSTAIVGSMAVWVYFEYKEIPF